MSRKLSKRPGGDKRKQLQTRELFRGTMVERNDAGMRNVFRGVLVRRGDHRDIRNKNDVGRAERLSVGDRRLDAGHGKRMVGRHRLFSDVNAGQLHGRNGKTKRNRYGRVGVVRQRNAALHKPRLLCFRRHVMRRVRRRNFPTERQYRCGVVYGLQTRFFQHGNGKQRLHAVQRRQNERERRANFMHGKLYGNRRALFMGDPGLEWQQYNNQPLHGEPVQPGTIQKRQRLSDMRRRNI